MRFVSGPLTAIVESRNGGGCNVQHPCQRGPQARQTWSVEQCAEVPGFGLPTWTS